MREERAADSGYGQPRRGRGWRCWRLPGVQPRAGRRLWRLRPALRGRDQPQCAGQLPHPGPGRGGGGGGGGGPPARPLPGPGRHLPRAALATGPQQVRADRGRAVAPPRPRPEDAEHRAAVPRPQPPGAAGQAGPGAVPGLAPPPAPAHLLLAPAGARHLAARGPLPGGHAARRGRGLGRRAPRHPGQPRAGGGAAAGPRQAGLRARHDGGPAGRHGCWPGRPPQRPRPQPGLQARAPPAGGRTHRGWPGRAGGRALPVAGHRLAHHPRRASLRGAALLSTRAV